MPVSQSTAEKREDEMIEEIFDELKKLGAVSSRTRFSQDWLGMEGSYFRGGRRKHGSARALATCAARLRHRARVLEHSDYAQVRIAATRYENLADQCIEQLLQGAEGEAK